MLIALDHAVIAVRDLDAASARYAALLGRAPSWRGAHPGLGSANVLFRLGNMYLELLAPSGDGGLAARLKERLDGAGEGLFGLAFATDDAAETALELRERGLDAADPVPAEGRALETGAVRRWRHVLLPEAQTRGLWLFAVEHASPPEALAVAAPAAPEASVVTGLDHVVVASDDVDATAALYGRGLGLRLALDRSFPERGVRLLFFRIGGVTVELAGRLGAPPEPDAADPSGGRASDRFGGLAWQVPDVGAAHARLDAAGFDVSDVRPGNKPGTRVCTVRAPTHGVPTLVIEPAPR